MSFKRVKVVMLPTKEKATVDGIVTRPSDNRMAIVNVLTKDDPQPCIHQHLYFLSDEEIKEGDWVYSVLYGIGHVEKDYGNSLRPLTVKFGNSEVRQSYHRNGFYDNLDVSAHNCKKIIATTDKSLLDTIHNPSEEFKHIWELPQPSQSFVEKYVEEYNKGNIITEVMVEYECKGEMVADTGGRMLMGWYDGDNLPRIWKSNWQLKINPKDNTITIRKIKDSWNREEVERLCRMAYRDAEKAVVPDYEDKWIEENL